MAMSLKGGRIGTKSSSFDIVSSCAVLRCRASLIAVSTSILINMSWLVRYSWNFGRCMIVGWSFVKYLMVTGHLVPKLSDSTNTLAFLSHVRSWFSGLWNLMWPSTVSPRVGSFVAFIVAITLQCRLLSWLWHGMACVFVGVLVLLLLVLLRCGMVWFLPQLGGGCGCNVVAVAATWLPWHVAWLWCWLRPWHDCGGCSHSMTVVAAAVVWLWCLWTWRDCGACAMAFVDDAYFCRLPRTRRWMVNDAR